MLLLSVESESTHTYNTHAALKAFQSALPLHPHAHNKPALHPHTHSVSKIHFLTLYKLRHTHTHTHLYNKKDNTKRNHDSREAGDIYEVLHTQYFTTAFPQ